MRGSTDVVLLPLLTFATRRRCLFVGGPGRGKTASAIIMGVLAGYSGLSVRKLYDYLEDAAHPLPCYRVGGKILVRRSEFDGWIARHRQVGRTDVDQIVADVLRSL